MYMTLTTNSIGTGVQLTPVSDSAYHLLEGVVYSSTNLQGVYAVDVSDSQFVIDGTVSALHNAFFLSNATGISLTIGETGRVSAGANTAVALNGNDNFVHNSGAISSGGTVSVYLVGDDTQFVNDGTVMVSSRSSGRDGVLFSGGETKLVNTGAIHQSGPTGNGVTLYNPAGLTGEVWNFGLISASDKAIEGNLGIQRIHNSGEIIGDVSLGQGDDLFDGRGGTVEGTVFGGAGDDLYIVDDGEIMLSEQSDEGHDVVQARTDWTLGLHFESLKLVGSGDFNGTGTAGNDLLRGNRGDNRLDGRGGIDTIAGGDGDDVLRGNGDGDVLSGGSGRDILRGGSGDDLLNGGEGDDILIGGTGRDILNGGAGEDSFAFKRVSHSPNSGGDAIGDFTQGEDLIDLSGIPGALSWRGAAGFSGAGEGEVRLYVGVPGTRVKIDVDGNGSADMDILVQGVFAMTEADFLL